MEDRSRSTKTATTGTATRPTATPKPSPVATSQPSRPALTMPQALQLQSWRELVRHTLHDLRSSFSREHLGSTLKTLAWVVPLTIFIWIYAERAEVKEDDASVSLAVISSDPARAVVEFAPDSPRQVLATLEGPASNVQRAREELKRGALTLEIDPSLGSRQLDAKSLLSSQSFFVDQGITIKQCAPTNLAVVVDPIQEIDVEVRIAPELADVVVSPSFDRPHVKVRGPRGLFERARAAGQLYLYAMPDMAALKGQDRFDGEARLQRREPLLRESVSVASSSVHVTFATKRPDVQETISSVPLYVRGSPDLFRKWQLVFVNPSPVSPTAPDAAVISNVKVVGPPDKIAQIQRGEFRPVGYFPLTNDDMPPAPQPRTATIRYELPDGVTLDPSDASRATRVEFRITERSASE